MNDGWEKLMEIGERTFQFAVRIVKLGQFIEKNGGVTKILSGQVLRLGTSIGANVAEAQRVQSDGFRVLSLGL
ncbi:MAG: four helix bundle protein [Cyanobacteriota bacterium]|nr:four helix bundle protein [Cyanobacteriota bacterium]